MIQDDGYSTGFSSGFGNNWLTWLGPAGVAHLGYGDVSVGKTGWQVLGGIYNAIGYFATGSTVTITIYDVTTGGTVATDSAACGELGSSGIFVWDIENLTVMPITYKEYAFKMTDGADVTLDQGGKVIYPEPFTINRMNPILQR